MLHIKNHFLELKYKLIYISVTFFLTFFSCYFYAKTLAYFYTKPLIIVKQNQGLSIYNYDFIFTSVSEVFSSYLLISFISTCFFITPICLIFFFSFLKTGLFQYEKLYFIYFIFLIIMLAIFSIFFVYYTFLPLILTFFISFEDVSFTDFFTIKLEAKFLDYIFLVSQTLLFVFFLFQIPVFFFFILTLGLIDFKRLQKSRRLFLLMFFILGGIFSPPDIYAQLIIALPLSFCFECLLFVLYLQKMYSFYFN